MLNSWIHTVIGTLRRMLNTIDRESEIVRLCRRALLPLISSQDERSSRIVETGQLTRV